MRKILIVKGVCYYNDWGDENFTAQNGEPHEVDDETYALLQKHMYRLNHGDIQYRMVEYVQPKELGDVVTSIKEMVAKDEAAALQRKQQREAAAAKSTETKLANKRKQLEKLKRELGENG